MYESFYGLKDRPFSIIPNPDVLYMSDKHRSAFAHVQYGLMEGTGVVVLTGDIGTGKTTMIRYLLSRIHQAMEVAVIFNTNVTGSELLRLIIQDFEIGEPQDDKAANISMLHDFLLQKFSLGRKSVVIIDEAQNLSAEALEEIRLLSNLQGRSDSLLQVVLVGQPELRHKLADPRLTQLAQRVTTTFHLEGLTDDEVREYVRFRLVQAGGRADLFDESALQAIARGSRGIPRVINILCNGALVLGFADEVRTITGELIESVIQETGSMMYGVSHQDAPTVSVNVAGEAGQELRVQGGRVQALEERLLAMQDEQDRLKAEIHKVKGHVAKLLHFVAERDKAAVRRAEGFERELAVLQRQGVADQASDEPCEGEESVDGYAANESLPSVQRASAEESGLHASEAAGTEETLKAKGFWAGVRTMLGRSS